MRRSGVVCFLVVAAALRAESGVFHAVVPAAAERYVALAFERNLALQVRALDVEQARARLAEAKSHWQPRLDLVARYSQADGGRTIDIPTGDLLNGVYRTLNDYLASQGRPGAFPTLENQSIPLLREQEQETKLRLVQPLYRPEIARGVAAARAAAGGREAQLAAYRRELRLAVLTGYHGYLQAEMAREILVATAAVTAEAWRVNRVLADADKVTEDRVLRAESDDLAVQQQQAEAERERNTARAYFNFLLNRPLGEEIERPSEAEQRALAETLLAAGEPAKASAEGREELAALRSAVTAAEAREAAADVRRRPTLVLAVEGGIQGTSYRTTGTGAEFVQGSLLAEFNLWDGQERRSQLAGARIERRQAELVLAEAREQLGLQLQRARDDYRAALAAYRTAERRGVAATRAFDLVAQRAREGLVAQLNFLDARTEATRAELNRAITCQRLFIAAATLDRAAALTPLP